MTYEVDSYEGYDSHAWTSVVTGCFIFLLKFWNDLLNFSVTDTNFWYAIAFHIFWMESVRLASTLLLPRLWHKARGRYPSPEVRARFNTQLLSLLASCALVHNNRGIILRWSTKPPFLIPDEATEHFELTGAKMEWTCWFTLAYLIHDTMHMLMTWKFTKMKSMLLHHIFFAIIANSGACVLGNPASPTFAVNDCIVVTLIFSFMESSTIFLNIRWLVAIVLCKGQPKSKFVKLFLTINEFLFLALFIFFRLFLFSGIVALVVWKRKTIIEEEQTWQPVFFPAAGMAYALNWYWAYDSISAMRITKNEKAKRL